MATIKSNERELSAKVAQWFDEIIKSSAYSFKEASTEAGVTADSRTLFADTIIWYNRQSKQAASYIELKPPKGKKENLDTFKNKAVGLHVQYAFTWNFQTLKCYGIKEGNINLIREEQIAVLSNIEEWTRIDKQAIVKSVIGKICDELSTLLETGKPSSFIPDKIFFVELIRKTTQQLLDVFEPFVQQAQYKKAFKNMLAQYARLQGIPTSEDHIKILTNHVVYGLITKIIFYLTIRRYFKDLPALDEAEGIDLSSAIRKGFAKARERDWQAVFEEDPIEELGIPKDAHRILFEFFSELRAYHFGELPEDVLGQLFEEIIDPEKRHSLGQYFTREDLVDLVIAAVVRDKDGNYCDPTCGSGTFLVRLYDRLRYLSANRKTHKELLDQIWGFDIGKFPAELSTVNLFRQNVREYNNFPRVRKIDIFKVVKGSSFDFPPPHSGSKAMKINLKLPEFQSIVGNFPYIRQELIEKEFKGYKRYLTKILAEEWLQAYPQLFIMKGIKPFQLTSSKQIENALGKDLLDLRLSGQADIYAYIYLHTATLLNSEGAFAIITSNSWLDVAYGSILQQFILDHFRVKMIIASWAEPWFEDAAVNTVITVLEKEEDEEKRKNNSVHFVKLKKKLTELVPYDIKYEANRRWQTFDAIVATIEESKYKQECKEIAPGISSYDSNDMRIRIIAQQSLVDELYRKEEPAKWGKYLRAPDVYFEILERCKDILVPLKQIADVRRGYTTGVNEFFYLEKVGKANSGIVKCRNDREWEGEIEEKYLKEVIKSPKEADGIKLDKKQLKNYLFLCPKSKNELKADNEIGALKYIEWGEKQSTKDGVAWNNVPTVKSRKYWWVLEDRQPYDFMTLGFVDKKHRVLENNLDICAGDVLFEWKFKNNKFKDAQLRFLNSTLFYLFLEVSGRVSLGDGVLKVIIPDLESVYVPREILASKLPTLRRTESETIFDEVRKKDRIELDTAIMETLDLDPGVYLDKIYEGISEMVRERLELPKMRKKQQKESVKIAVEQIKQSVIDECLANGPKRFPEQFYDRPLNENELDKYSATGETLRYEHFFGQYQVMDAKDQKVFIVDSENKAQYACILAKPNIYEIKIPKDDKMITKALTRYHKYLRELEEKLTKSASQQTHDWAIAERIAKDIMAEYGLK
jgi:type I restriction enzyme M protein